jgi:crotonobetainyl-CoA:carnitine CoA-transferase CaiB-like acyl-CoA transferase
VLEGLKIVEFATYVAGPGAAAVLADWGADVVKIERSAGDPTRHLFDARPELEGNPVFEFENHSKRSVALDVTQPQGREALLRILKGADVFITNLRQRTLAKSRLHYSSIRDELPHLIYCSITGYGSEGEAADWPAFDIAALWTRAGMAGVIIPEGVDPFPCRPGMGDSICALAATSAVLAALVERGRSGRGRLVETSLMRAGVYAVGWDLAMQLKFGVTNPAKPRSQAPNALSNYYRTADGRWLCMLARTPDDWPVIAKALGLVHLAEDARFVSPEARAIHAGDLIAILDVVFARLTLQEAMTQLTGHDLIGAPLQTAAEVAADPLAHAAGCFVETTDADGARFLSPASPAYSPEEKAPMRHPAPRLGQHTRTVLADAGYTAQEIDALIRSGAAQD